MPVPPHSHLTAEAYQVCAVGEGSASISHSSGRVPAFPGAELGPQSCGDIGTQVPGPHVRPGKQSVPMVPLPRQSNPPRNPSAQGA